MFLFCYLFFVFGDFCLGKSGVYGSNGDRGGDRSYTGI